jgi:hypothetical protein
MVIDLPTKDTPFGTFSYFWHFFFVPKIIWCQNLGETSRFGLGNILLYIAATAWCQNTSNFGTFDTDFRLWSFGGAKIVVRAVI